MLWTLYQTVTRQQDFGMNIERIISLYLFFSPLVGHLVLCLILHLSPFMLCRWFKSSNEQLRNIDKDMTEMAHKATSHTYTNAFLLQYGFMIEMLMFFSLRNLLDALILKWYSEVILINFWDFKLYVPSSLLLMVAAKYLSALSHNRNAPVFHQKGEYLYR